MQLVYGAAPASYLTVPGFIKDGVFVSFDGGRTWKDVAFSTYPKGHPDLLSNSDPMVTVTSEGTFYIAWDDLHLSTKAVARLAARSLWGRSPSTTAERFSRARLAGQDEPVPSRAMAEATLRDRKTRATRARIAEAALDLFANQGYAETTIDQIAAAGAVSRRTVFHHFPTKAAMLVDHLVGRREEALQRLRERPRSEPILASLHAVLREFCERGYDRRLLAQIRAVVTTEPQVAAEHFSPLSGSFKQDIVAVLQARTDNRRSLEVHALTLMALNWVVTAAHIYLIEGRRSLVACFDEVVAACARATAHDLP